MPNQAAVYCRISQDRTGQGLGVARQEEDCRAWAERHGWDVAEVYVDDDISAYRGRPRPSYKRLLADIDAKRRDGLVVWHPDRLHRSPRELEDFIDLLERTGIPVGTVTAGDIDLTTATGRMTARIVGAVARHESDHKADRIRRKHIELADNGRVPGGGIRPFGYEADRKTVRSEEATLIREAAHRVLSGDGLRTIVADWNHRGVTTVTGVPWSTTTLRRLLRSARIIGWREHHGRLVAKAEWAAIVDETTGRRLRRLLDDPVRNKFDTTARLYLLAGMVRCGNPDCGANLVARPAIQLKNGTRYRYRRYACTTDKGGCNKVGIGAQPLEDLIVEAVMIRLDSAQFVRRAALRRQQAQREDDPIEGIEQRLNDLAEMFADGSISRAEWATARAGLSKRLDEARKVQAVAIRQRSVTDQLAEPGLLRREWPSLNLDRQRLVLAAMIAHIVIAPTTKAGNKFDPGRVDVQWRV